MSDITNYLQQIEDRIDSITDCETLSIVMPDIESELSALKADIAAQLDLIAPLLVVPSANLFIIVNWITKLIGTFTDPYNALLAEQIIVTTRVASILAKLSSRISSLSCDFTAPTDIP